MYVFPINFKKKTFIPYTPYSHCYTLISLISNSIFTFNGMRASLQFQILYGNRILVQSPPYLANQSFFSTIKFAHEIIIERNYKYVICHQMKLRNYYLAQSFANGQMQGSEMRLRM